MFTGFFFTLKNVGVPVNPKAFLKLQEALKSGLISSMDDFYTGARTILVKSERYFDLYDQVYAYYFEGAEFPEEDGLEMDEIAKGLLDEWLKNPKEIGEMLGIDENKIGQMTPEELIEYFKERLNQPDRKTRRRKQMDRNRRNIPCGPFRIPPQRNESWRSFKEQVCC